jgi:lysophospholipase L1-like esterase
MSEGRRKFSIPNYMISVTTVAVVWIILELFCSIAYRHLPQKFDNGKRIVEINLGRPETIPASIIQHPYMLYSNNPNYFDSVQQHNSLGYRDDEFTIKKPPNTIRILALGGSTTYGYRNRNPRTTWPEVLQQMLERDVTKKVEVINAGLKYGTSAELLSSYIFRHRYLKPDIIIFHEGGNDAIPVFFPNYNPEYTHFREHGTGSKLRRGEKLLLRSNVFKVFYSMWLNPNESVYKAQPFPLDELDPAEVQQRIHDEKNFEGFRRNVELLIQLARMDSTQIVLFGFVQAREENLNKNREDFTALKKSVIECVAKNNAIMKELAARYHLIYINASQDRFDDSWFLDNCHLNQTGEAMKAQIVYENIRGLIPADKLSLSLVP